MTTPTMRNIVPKELIPALKVLGKHDWLEWWPSNSEPPSTSMKLKIPDDPALAEHKAFLFKLQFAPSRTDVRQAEDERRAWLDSICCE